jgi:hypothetical protein
MFKFFRRVIKGAGYLEGYGHHPGTLLLAVFILCCGLAGIKNGKVFGFFGGMAFGAICMGPFYIIGCVERAKGYEEAVVRTFNRLKEE